MTFSNWNTAQRAVARKTYLAVRGMGLYERAATICILTQMVESSLQGPIPGDKPGWWGAYQQSDAWVPAAVRNTPQDPRNSIGGGTALFLYGGYSAGTPGMLAQPWITQPMGVTCQQVQKSNTPLAYTQLEADATAMVGWLFADPATRDALAVVV